MLARLRGDGHDVWNLDREGERNEGFVRVDLTDAGQVMDVLAGLDDRYAGLDAVVHLAAIPAPARPGH